MERKNSEKTFVIDTNVLIHNPEALLSFRDTEIVIPLWVLEELDSLKTYSDQRGKAARDAIRFIDSQSRSGNLRDGVRLPNGSLLKVAMGSGLEPPEGLDIDKNDNRIVMTAYSLTQEGKRVFFVSKDINARVKATAMGVKTVDYEKQKAEASTLHSGVLELAADEAALDCLARLSEAETGLSEARSAALGGSSPAVSACLSEARAASQDLSRWLEAHSHRLGGNEYLVVRDRDSVDYLVRRHPSDPDRMLALKPREAVVGVQALNARQRVAFELLLDDQLPLVSLVGKAGTGKTLLAIAAGLHKTLEEKAYSRLLVSRPVVPVGKDIGYLPGEKGAKMANWMTPIFDNLEYIFSVYKKPNFKSLEQVLKDKLIEIEAVSLIRGRSLPRQYIIIDEAQNLTPHEIKTIVSRAGEGAKVVLTGDPFQIDNLYLDQNSNGLSYLVDRFRGQRLYGHVNLQKSERSALAELAAELL